LERALGAAGLNAQRALPLVAPLLDLPVPKGYPPVLAAPDVARRRLLATLAAWMLGAARLQPLVVFVEDLQWVDPSTLELRQLLVEQGATTPLLLLYTARPEFRPPWPFRAHHTQLTLSQIGRASCRESEEVWVGAASFQAEDGIRDRNVTGVQTCALPISPPAARRLRRGSPVGRSLDPRAAAAPRRAGGDDAAPPPLHGAAGVPSALAVPGPSHAAHAEPDRKSVV